VPADQGLYRRNAAFIHHVGPCIGLFRTPLDHDQEPTVHYDITRQPIPESVFLKAIDLLDSSNKTS